MMPITDFLSCTDLIDDFECFSYHQKHHAKTYVTGLIASGDKTVESISKRVLRSKSERALNKFLNQYNWDEDRLNRERLDALQQRNETRWSKDGVVILDDSVTHRTSGDKVKIRERPAGSARNRLLHRRVLQLPVAKTV